LDDIAALGPDAAKMPDVKGQQFVDLDLFGSAGDKRELSE